MYAKAHSYGEYVFDHGWAAAFERAGGRYYPKLQVASPFSPVPGPRLLLHPEILPEDRPGVLRAMAGALSQSCGELKLSSVHVTFCRAEEYDELGKAGWLQRLGTQFHWENADYRTFEDFLGQLSSRKRKSVRRERRDANGCGLEYRTLRGTEITPQHWKAFYRFYTATVDRKWGSAYLSEGFFPLLSERLGGRVVLMLAEHNGKPVAGALNLLGDDALYDETGDASATGHSCILNYAIIALSSLRSNMDWPGSRPVRRANIKSSVATCRARPIRRTGSPILDCETRWPNICRKSVRRASPRWRLCRHCRHTGKRIRSARNAGGVQPLSSHNWKVNLPRGRGRGHDQARHAEARVNDA